MFLVNASSFSHSIIWQYTHLCLQILTFAPSFLNLLASFPIKKQIPLIRKRKPTIIQIKNKLKGKNLFRWIMHINQSLIVPRDVVLPPPLTPTIITTAGFLIDRHNQNYDQPGITLALRQSIQKLKTSIIFKINLKPSRSSVLFPLLVNNSNTLFFKAAYKIHIKTLFTLSSIYSLS